MLLIATIMKPLVGYMISYIYIYVCVQGKNTVFYFEVPKGHHLALDPLFICDTVLCVIYLKCLCSKGRKNIRHDE